MSIPAGQPSDQPPLDPSRPHRKARRQGALVAILVAFVGILAGYLLAGYGLFFVGPGSVVLCVIVGSVLTIFERTRQFAVGFLIASAIILVVTAGVCAALIASISSSFGLGTA